MLCRQRYESAMMDDGIGGVRVCLTHCRQTHTLQQCDGYTKEVARGDDVARRFPFSPFPLECGAPVQPELIYHDRSTRGKE